MLENIPNKIKIGLIVILPIIVIIILLIILLSTKENKQKFITQNGSELEINGSIDLSKSNALFSDSKLGDFKYNKETNQFQITLPISYKDENFLKVRYDAEVKAMEKLGIVSEQYCEILPVSIYDSAGEEYGTLLCGSD